MSTPGKLEKFLALSSNDRRLLISALILLTAIRLGLVIFPFDKMRYFLSKLIPGHLVSSVTEEFQSQQIIQRVVWAINASGRHLPISMNCFPRALATHVLLQRRGIPSEIKIGVARNEDGVFEAHAWVEYRGQVVIGRLEDLGRFTTLSHLNEKLA